MLRFALLVGILSCCSAAVVKRAWPVTVHIGRQAHVLRVPEGQPVLLALEAAGLLPGSDCRRGNCLSCAARIINGAPFSLRVRDNTALCSEAHESGFVLLCSAYVCGKGLEIEVDMEGEVWELQYSKRFGHDPLLKQRRRLKPHFRREDVEEHLEHCRLLKES
uniref:2Fe-2S ferredoxin-type domain-containing protein n=1 Tax=Chrysotila carterae TaxID=13221 RepID=A0A7S4F9M2_CHRCT|mmetsp:Transcript_29045/g.60965  ORF Transcript_29045/g.60965 Transcript_29045/m.60965 type:complete len:163 (-) Transcript_29045:464-952(-)|eukprot:6172886-Pleurochrysis_carterae.AAC.3